jgi:hypothetical protein
MLEPRERQAPDGPKQGGNQSTDISRINRRDLLAPSPPPNSVEQEEGREEETMKKN